MMDQSENDLRQLHQQESAELTDPPDIFRLSSTSAPVSFSEVSDPLDCWENEGGALADGAHLR